MTGFIDEVFGNPTIHPDAFVDPAATLIGRVEIDQNVLVAPNAVLRADEQGPFRVCSGSNIQDGVLMHGHKDEFVVGSDGRQYSVYVGERTVVAHRAMLHGPVNIMGKTFIDAAAMIWRATIGEGCVILAAAKIRSADIGCFCLIGPNATIWGDPDHRLKVPDHKYVPAGAVVNSVKDCKRLPDVEESVLEAHLTASHEILSVNHELVTQHKKRSDMLKKHTDERVRDALAGLFRQPEMRRNPNLRRHVKNVIEVIQRVA